MEKISDPRPPSGLTRLVFRLPILLYRARLGWLLGRRFLLLTHIGRQSGLPRQTVLEVVQHEKATGIYYVASGWGSKSDWYRNIAKNPKVKVQVGKYHWQATAEQLPPSTAGNIMVEYGQRHPATLQGLARFMGYRIQNSDKDYRALGEIIPILAHRPIT